MLTVEGTYTSGDRQGITVSHEIDFGTMQIKRNYLYKVRIALEDPAGDTYGKVTHAINVKDWTSGVTLAWAGDENLYNNLAAANFTVSGTSSKLVDATPTILERHLVNPFNAEKSATFYVTSTSTKSGLSLTCPATAIAATAGEGGGYQCTITPQASTYSENGEFTQKWQVTVRESAMLAGNILTFTLQNALNSALSASFEVIGAPFINNTSDILAGDVYYTNGLWSRPSDRDECAELLTPTGIIAPVAAYESADGDTMLGDDYCAKLYSKISVGDVFYDKGFWSPGAANAAASETVVQGCISAGNQVIGIITRKGTTTYDQAKGYSHAYVLALSDVSNSTISWCSESLKNTLICDPADVLVSSVDNALNDLDGLKHCDVIKSKVVTNLQTDFPALYAAEQYKNTAPTPLLSSGWYLPGLGQLNDLVVSFADSFTTSGWSVSSSSITKGNYSGTFANEVNNTLSKKLGTTAYSTIQPCQVREEGWWASSEANATTAVTSFIFYQASQTSYLFYAGGDLKDDASRRRMRVRAVLAF